MVAAPVIATALWWAALPSALELVTAVRNGTAAEVSLDGLLAALASCLSLLLAGLLLVSSVLVVVVRVLSARFAVLAALEHLTGPAWWRRLVLAACGLGLVVPNGPSSAWADDTGGESHGGLSQGNPLVGLSLPDLPAVSRSAPSPQHRAPGHPATPQTVTVRAGDSLWRIVAESLEPAAGEAAIAREVHQLYLTNRSVIGPDPDLIFPGTELTPPGGTHDPTS